MVSAKRKRPDDDADDSTPRKLRAQAQDDETEDAEDVGTPSGRSRRRLLADNATPRSILKKRDALNGVNDDNGTPKSQRKLVFATPSKHQADDIALNGTPTLVRNADRSARRKSNRRLIERTTNGGESDDEGLEEEDSLAQQILSDEEEELPGAGAGEPPVPAVVPDTPSKRGRGRPKGSGKKQQQKQPSPTAPTDLPPHEKYFWENRLGGTKTSNNTLPSNILLNHDEFFQAIQAYEDHHQPEKDFLLGLHSRAYDQWLFELDQGFNICLYGYGSKRPITEAFSAHLYEHLLDQSSYTGSKKTPKIVVINGYASGVTLKDVLTTVASTILAPATKTPNQPSSLLAFILDHLTENPPPHPVPIIVNSIDSYALRKSPTPSMLATLAAHKSISLLCTADTPNFGLLWDVGLRAQFRFLFHDATTFAPYDAEIDVVESVNELLGRSGRRVGGRDGVGFVLRSLPENARSLFRILVAEQLALSMGDGGNGADEEEMTVTPRNKKIAQARNAPTESTQGVEYRVLYHKAVEEFVCSSEVSFRTLLKEFHDHQMVESRKDAMGTERLWVPFRPEELEGLLEDLSGEIL